MYSVIRFHKPPGSSLALAGLGRMIEAVQPGSYRGPDRDESRCSCSLSRSSPWPVHEAEVLKMLSSLDGVIREARENGYEVGIDIALEPEDREGQAYDTVEFSQELLDKVVGQSIRVALTVYV
jgi:hypothetical protein